MRPWLVLLVFVLGLFAGCLDDADGSFVTARDALPAARSDAKDWQSDAALVAASSFELGDELRQQMADDLAEERQEMAEDSDDMTAEERKEAEDELRVMEAIVAAGPDRIGDGKAAVWVFLFASDSSGEGFFVATDARGVLLSEVFADNEFSFGLGGDAPLGEWALDSDAAAQVALEGNEAYNALSESKQAAAYTILIQGDDNPFWLLGIEDDDSDDEVLVAVDAVNGTLLSVDDLFGQFVPLFQEFGDDSGSFLPIIGEEADSEFDVELAGHMALAVHLSVMPPPVMPVSVVVTDPNGLTSSFEVGTDIAIAAEGSVLLPAAPRGEYNVHLSTTLAANQDWTLSWCTDGESFDFGFAFPRPACDLVPSSNARNAELAPSETISHWLAVLGL